MRRSPSGAVADLHDEVAATVHALPARYLRGRLGHRAPRTYQLLVGPSQGWAIVADDDRCTVWPRTSGPADAVVSLDARSWLDLIQGRVSGLELFFRGALEVHGDLNEALRMDTLFARPPGSVWEAWHPEVRDVVVDLPTVTGRLAPATVETYLAGPADAQPIVFVHGLGASKVSLLPAMAGLARTHRVVALDLPGFGHSQAPLDAPYTPAWLAASVRATLHTLGIHQAVLVGNSLGGRTAVELALRAPREVAGLVLLCPAVGFKQYRRVRGVLRLGRPDVPLALLPWLTRGRVPEALVDRLLRSLFADHTRVPAQNLLAARDEALRILSSPRNRYALLAATRQIGLDDDRRFWQRLRRLRPPSLWIFGDRDVLVSPGYARIVADVVPAADVQVWESTGHVPQFEHRQRTADAIGAFVDAL